MAPTTPENQPKEKELKKELPLGKGKDGKEDKKKKDDPKEGAKSREAGCVDYVC